MLDDPELSQAMYSIEVEVISIEVEACVVRTDDVPQGQGVDGE